MDHDKSSCLVKRDIQTTDPGLLKAIDLACMSDTVNAILRNISPLLLLHQPL